jgi:hypothetical protein
MTTPLNLKLHCNKRLQMVISGWQPQQRMELESRSAEHGIARCGDGQSNKRPGGLTS